MICDYQKMVHDSSTTLFEFRSNSLKALSNQKDAVELFNENEFADCLEQISENKVIKAILVHDNLNLISITRHFPEKWLKKLKNSPRMQTN